jgi:transposase
VRSIADSRCCRAEAWRPDALFDIERGISGQSTEERRRVRLCLAALEAWLREQRSRLSNSSSVAKPIDYMLRRC